MTECNRHPRESVGPMAIGAVMPYPGPHSPANNGTAATSLINAWRHHWPEYLIEATGLGVFMIVAGLCVVLLEHPASSLSQAIPSPDLRRAVIGMAMGATGGSDHLLALGTAVRRASEPGGNLDFFAAGKGRAGGRAVLRARPVYRRCRGHAADGSGTRG